MQKLKKLLDVTKDYTYKGIEQAIVGNRVGDISYAVQQYAESHNYGVVRELVGHGLVKIYMKARMPNYGKRT